MCYSGLIYTWINKTIIWYDLGMSRIPPIPPQFGIAVGFYFVGKFISEWKTIGVGIHSIRLRLDLVVEIRFGSGIPRALSVGRVSDLTV